MTIGKTPIKLPDALQPIAQFINGEISIDEFRHWLDTARSHPLNIASEGHLISSEEQARRRDAVRQANASVTLEGFVIAPEIAWLNECYIRGHISIDEKGSVLRKLFRVE
jgi:hypothetical protein